MQDMRVMCTPELRDAALHTMMHILAAFRNGTKAPLSIRAATSRAEKEAKVRCCTFQGGVGRVVGGVDKVRCRDQGAAQHQGCNVKSGERSKGG